MDSEQNVVEEPSSIKHTSSDALDWFLQNLVSMTNKYRISYGVTLSVGGLLISGMIIDGRTYFEDFASEMKEGFLPISEEAASSMETIFRSYGDIYREAQDKLLEEQQNENAEASVKETFPPAVEEPNYIHLKDAKVYHPSGAAVPGNRGLLMRLRLGAIDGFAMGQLSKG